MSSITVRNPFDLSTVGEVPLMPEAEAFAALARAHALHGDPARRIPAHERLAILERLATLMRTHADALVRDAVREGGKPWADSVVEVERAIDGVRWAARELAQLGGREVPMGLTPASAGRLAFTVREPRGVVLAISAFNHPVNLIVHQVVPAFASGCPVLVKPASATPLSCRNVLRLMHEAGVPEAWATMLSCAAATAEKLVADPRVAFLSFIGSSRVGWHLRSKLAPGATCALEHGGAAPVVLDASADLDAALPLLLKGGFYHAGQVCVSVQRVFAPHETARTFAERLAAAAAQLPTGDPMRPDTAVGPLIDPREVSRVHEWVEEARAGGGTVLCGGAPLSETLYAPTVVYDPPQGCRLARNEVFGPVVAVFSTRDRDEAIARANDVPFIFQAAVFARDVDVALDTARRLNATGVMVNDHTAFRVDWMPFGGRGESGMGTGGIGPAMHEMTAEKLIVLRSTAWA